MKNTILMLTSALLLSTALTANASTYNVIYGEKQISGKNISFVRIGKWLPTTPVISEWSSAGASYTCTNWSPTADTVAVGTTFPQTATDCSIQESRTTQNREQNNDTQAYRNVGNITTESRTLTNQTTTRTANGTKIVNDCGTADLNQYRWVNGTPSMSMMYVIWGGVKVFPDIGNINLTEYTYNGYKYTKGAQKSNLGYYTFHSVCRIKI